MAARLNLQRLPNVPYRHPRSSVMGPHERDHLFFSCHGVEGVNLADARAGQFEDLDGRDEELFPASFVKVTCLITVRSSFITIASSVAAHAGVQIHGYRVCRQVKNVQRVRKGAPVPIPRHRVVRCIADAMFAFLNQVSTQALAASLCPYLFVTTCVKTQATDDHDWTFTFGPGGIEMEHLYLTELRRYGKTLVPVFGYVACDAGPTVVVRR